MTGSSNRDRTAWSGRVTTLAALLSIPTLVADPLLIWPVMLAMGASLGSYYIVAMTMMGRSYRGADLIGVNTSFVFIWGLGAAVGPSLSGTAMDLFGPDGMPIVGALLCAVFVLVVLRKGKAIEGGPGGG